ncbi:hypothetical protein BKA64DRAFT_658064 [Cadophora sp. MPI-SDFR-AT-0126]|nr:hypothetical protein BKA64DRAFT_658064 [Leotiomycetes sp. MPI-SDFR-AT-0126]
MLVLFTWLLAGLVILLVMFASIRNSRALDGIGRAGKVVFSALQDSPLLVVAGTGFICGVVGLYWHCWRNTSKYVWLTDCAFLPTLLDSVLTFFTALINICAARGRHWLVSAFVTVSVATSTTLVAIIIYMVYVGLTDSAWGEHRTMKEAHVAQ